MYTRKRNFTPRDVSKTIQTQASVGVDHPNITQIDVNIMETQIAIWIKLKESSYFKKHFPPDAQYDSRWVRIPLYKWNAYYLDYVICCICSALQQPEGLYFELTKLLVEANECFKE